MLTEREVLYAISKTNCNASAANFLGISPITWKKYASLYKDPETGKSLYQKHKSQGVNNFRRDISHGNWKYYGLDGLQRILNGEYPDYTGANLKSRIISEGIFPEECSYCGFDEKRITDYTVPLVLVWKDGDKRNHKKENLALCCYNCYYLCYHDIGKKSDRIRLMLQDSAY
jgi:hypothetical protein